MSKMNSVNSDYLVLEFNYTTADIEQNSFSGETPNPVYFAESEPPEKFSPITLKVIDGELYVVKDEIPPGAKLPNYDSYLFKSN
jgi:hypothetical protein